MAAEWSIISPVATTNLITNPSFETATTGWAAAGSATVAQSATQQRRGVYSLSVESTSASADGAYFGTVSLTSGTSYTFSVDVYGADGVPYQIYFATTGAVIKGTPTEFTGTGKWQRQSVTWACDSSTTYRVYVVKNDSDSQVIFYIDGAQVEALAYDTSYTDGDQGDGYEWTSAPHASTSYRLASTRAGGREYFLDSDIDTRVLLFDGVGMPPIQLNSNEYALLPGAVYQSSKTQVRTFTLVIQIDSTSVEGWHSKRKDLINLFKPDLVSPEQPILIRYYGADDETDAIEIEAYYSGGLEVNSPSSYRAGRIAIQLTAFDPYWYEQGNSAAVLDATDTVDFGSVAIFNKQTGVWSNAGTTTNDAVYCIAFNPANPDEVYVGGDFTDFAGVSGADYIAKYTISTATWSAVGAGSSVGGVVWAMLFVPDGNLYIGGAFTNVGDADGDYVAYFDGTNWNSLAAGGTGTVYALAYGGVGDFLYIGGDFDNWGSASGDNIVKWNGTAYAALSTGRDNTVRALAVGPDGLLYVGGDFTNFFASWNGSAFAVYGSNPQAACYSIAVAPDGRVFAGQDGYLEYWTGSEWVEIEAPPEVTADEYFSLVFIDNILYAGTGWIATAGYYMSNIAAWDGYGWYIPGIYWDNDCRAIATDGKGNIVADTGDLSRGVAGSTTITVSGTAKTYPKIRIVSDTGAGFGGLVPIHIITNVTNQETSLVFDYDLFYEETLDIDLQPSGRSITSNIYGSVWRAIRKSSDFTEFVLLPGSNIITAFVTHVDANAATLTMQWRNAHWSIDGLAE